MAGVGEGVVGVGGEMETIYLNNNKKKPVYETDL